MKTIETYPITANREIIHLPVGYQIKSVGYLHSIIRLYVMGDWGNNTVQVTVLCMPNSNEVPPGYDYVGTVEGKEDYYHVWTTDKYS